MAARIQTYDPTALPAPVTGWRQLFGDWLLVGRASVVCHGLGVATALLLRLLLSPAQIGIWQIVKMLLSYGNYSNLGISKGAAREYNVALGSGQTASARRGLDLAFTVNMLSSAVYATVLIGVGVWIAATSGSHGVNGWGLALAAVGGLAVLGRYVTFRVTILRTEQAFAVTAQLSMLEALLTLSACGLATWCWGLPGLYLGTLAVMLGSLVFVLRRSNTSLHWAWDGPEIRRLIGIGGPILLAGAASSLFRSLDKWMILGYLSDREFQLGCYSLALMVTTPLFGLGNMFAMVMGPRYGEKFGQSSDRPTVARLAARASELHAAAMALPAALALLVAEPLLSRLLPDYQPGLASLAWLIPGTVALVLALPASQYLVAVGRQQRALAAVLIGTAVAAFGNHLALAGGYGLSGVAGATAAGYVVYLVLAVGLSFWTVLDRFGRLRYLAMLALTLVPTLGAALWLKTPRADLAGDWPSLFVHGLLVCAVWAATVAVGWYHAGWRDEWRRAEQRNP